MKENFLPVIKRILRGKMLWKITGKSLKSLGSVLNRTDLFYLGHYLEGSGKKLPFPSKHKGVIVSLWEQLRDRDLDGEFIIIPSYDSVCVRDGMGNYIFEFPIPSGNELFRTLGKFRVQRVGNKMGVFDVYLWYKNCDTPWAHFRGCPCKNKKWVDLELIKSIPNKTKIRLLKIFRFGKVALEISFSNISITIVLSVSDSVWYRKGKSYKVYSLFKFEDGS